MDAREHHGVLAGRGARVRDAAAVGRGRRAARRGRASGGRLEARPEARADDAVPLLEVRGVVDDEVAAGGVAQHVADDGRPVRHRHRPRLLGRAAPRDARAAVGAADAAHGVEARVAVEQVQLVLGVDHALEDLHERRPERVHRARDDRAHRVRRAAPCTRGRARARAPEVALENLLFRERDVAAPRGRVDVRADLVLGALDDRGLDVAGGRRGGGGGFHARAELVVRGPRHRPRRQPLAPSRFPVRREALLLAREGLVRVRVRLGAAREQRVPEGITVDGRIGALGLEDAPRARRFRLGERDDERSPAVAEAHDQILGLLLRLAVVVVVLLLLGRAARLPAPVEAAAAAPRDASHETHARPHDARVAAAVTTRRAPLARPARTREAVGERAHAVVDEEEEADGSEEQQLDERRGPPEDEEALADGPVRVVALAAARPRRLDGHARLRRHLQAPQG